MRAVIPPDNEGHRLPHDLVLLALRHLSQIPVPLRGQIAALRNVLQIDDHEFDQHAFGLHGVDIRADGRTERVGEGRLRMFPKGRFEKLRWVIRAGLDFVQAGHDAALVIE